jgi:hypothetical protein
MKLLRLIAGVVAAAIVLAVPAFAFAFPFGGNASEVIPCYNNAIYALLGPPRGGPFLWTPSTQTFQFGPPRHSGQWLLGNAGPPYFCLVSILPITVYDGTDIIMMGSSQ